MSELSKKLIKWHKKSGRKDLPWQIQTNPYKVWISEVMLQQTQVQTVIPYYLRFIDRFPDINSLAESNENEVLSYWSWNWLGYYSRGRNLLKTAKILKDNFNSIMPQCSEKCTRIIQRSLELEKNQKVWKGLLLGPFFH